MPCIYMKCVSPIKIMFISLWWYKKNTRAIMNDDHLYSLTPPPFLGSLISSLKIISYLASACSGQLHETFLNLCVASLPWISMF